MFKEMSGDESKVVEVLVELSVDNKTVGEVVSVTITVAEANVSTVVVVEVEV